jgi:hypothetical protein
MASTSASVTNPSSQPPYTIRWTFSGLQYSSSNYNFEIQTNDGQYTYWDGSSGASSTTSGHAKNTYIYSTVSRAYLKTNSQWYTVTGSGTTTPNPSPPPPPPPPPPSAYVDCVVTNPNVPAPYTIRWTFQSLQYAASNYNFEIQTSDGKNAVWDGASIGTSSTTSGHAANTLVQSSVARAYFKAQSTWYNVQGSAIITPNVQQSEPARIQAQGRDGGIYDWWIINLSNPFNLSYYKQVAIFNTPFQNGATNPAGKISSVNATSSYSSHTTPTISVPGNTPGANYMIYGGAQAQNGLWYTCDSIVVSIPGQQIPPQGTPSVSATALPNRTISVTWGSLGAEATGYSIYMQDVEDGIAEAFKGSVGYTATSFTTTIDREYTNYQVRVVGTNTFGSGPSGYAYVKTLDETKPFVIYTKQIKAYSFRMDWNAYDRDPPSIGHQSGFKDLKIHISGPGGGNTFLVATSFAALAGLTFSTDGLGNPIKPQTAYRIYTICEDNGNNQYIVDETITTGAASAFRPDNFAWDTAKVSGQPYKVTADEWIALREKVQEFRQYKGLPPYPFSYNGTIYKGQQFTADIYNEMRSAIMSMSPPGSSPSAVVKGGPVDAAKLNAMRDYLNSIP